ncbi:MAG: family 43 glycosylhydrolase [Pseudomonadota bacterium]
MKIKSLTISKFNVKFLSMMFGVGALITLSSSATMAACTYSIDSEWSTGFTASIAIKNDTGTPINNWNVSWRYASNRMTSGWNANFSGTNPYAATNLNWNGSIAAGQTISFGVQGEKNGGSAERPTVSGTGCSGTTTSAPSSVRSSVASSSKVSSLITSSSVRSSVSSVSSIRPNSSSSSVATNACPSQVQNAFQAYAPKIPVAVQTEDFDPAGYSDSSTTNEGGAYRTDTAVDVKSISGGYAVGWMAAGEWLEYTIYVETEGDYDVTIRSGAVGDGRTLKISQCNTTLIESFSVPSVSTWGEFKTWSAGKVHLVPGYQKIRVAVGSTDYLDLDWIYIGNYSGPIDPKSSSSSSTSSSSSSSASTCPATYSNPLIWEDLPDSEVIRVDDAYYYTASTFHHSPGAPVLRSYDLVNWEYISHSVPVLDFDSSYNLSGSRSYVNGIWASSLQYRESNKTFYWMGCMHNKGGGYVFTAKSPEGPWTKNASQACYYDMGLLVDKDTDKMYVAWGNNSINVAELSADGMREVRRQEVFKTPSTISGPLEGSRFYKINGNYYIFMTQYANGEYVARSTTGPFGPYEIRPFAVKLPYAGVGSGGAPHQGGIVQTQNGDWYYIAFNDAFPAGRLPVMAPMTWSNGWPSVTLVNGQWGASYPFPKLPCGADKVKPRNVKDTFATSTLGHAWEWNHNPDNTKWATGNGLTLRTATVTNDLYAARNTLTRRIEGPRSIATIELDYSAMQNGDVSGLAALRDSSSWIGVKKANGATRIVMTNGATLDSSWNTNGLGAEAASANISGGKIWLRVDADVRTTSGGGTARFYYSTNGTQFTQLGGTFTMKREWNYFLGYRFGIFNYATQSLGGSVRVNSFDVMKP